MTKLVTYLHPHTCLTSKSPNLISFVGHSYRHFSQIREELEKNLADYPSLPVRKVDYSEFERVHSPDYLKTLERMALNQPVDEKPRLRGVTNWTNLEFRLLTEYVLEFAHRVSCPVLSTHGGGYKLAVTVSAAITHVDVLATYK
ncbi:MAG TPA: hypothetical protein V6D11_13465 [Waterburya sp.]